MSASELCPGCGHSLRWTGHLAHCILNDVTLSQDDLKILARVYLETSEAELGLIRKLRTAHAASNLAFAASKQWLAWDKA